MNFDVVSGIGVLGGFNMIELFCEGWMVFVMGVS